MRAEVYVGTTLKEKTESARNTRKQWKDRITSRALRTVRKLQEYSVKKEEDFNFKNPNLNKAAAALYNIPVRFAQANAGMLPSSMQKLIINYRAKRGVDESLDEYVKYSIRFSYLFSTLKIVSGLGLISIPVLAPGGAVVLAWGIYLSIVENPIRAYFRKKGKPMGVFIPYQLVNPFVKRIIDNGRNDKQNVKQKNDLGLIENNEKSLEERISSHDEKGLRKEITYLSQAASPSQIS